jgi:hypothetical protein
MPSTDDEVIMTDEFLVVWLDDDNSIVTHHRTSAEAFKRAKEVFQKYGQNIEIEIHLNEIGSIYSIGKVCISGFCQDIRRFK